ncbi:IS1182 family transposase [Alkalihalophilus marmarensis]|uniref:Uncharacterized protein n=1 Tax=Alkalihalophilus marmarensis DSM 21297 TaxID=1188261 RepID=U6SHC2_9BACI|nr:IS1182 family transposase [Alkalihalophilus marmarensis]ERN51129.1 hypothetical protein A33I_20940 [Alkalihalophilus marmarensis DSM 21297]
MNGCNVIFLICMFKYFLLKIIFDLLDVDVVECFKYDMLFKYFLDLVLEVGVIDLSFLMKFCKFCFLDEGLLDMLVGKSVEIVIEYNIFKDFIIIFDVIYMRVCFNKKLLKEFL